ncbi:MAG: RagB/SusD family nutrient uptake outer membrane protein [Siphonobacter sp.]
MKRNTILITTLLLGMFTSCKDSFLDVQPKAVLSATALQNAKGVSYLLTGAYSLLDGWATSGGAFRSYQSSSDNWVYGSIMGGDAYKGTIAGDQPAISLIEQYQIQSDNVYFQGKWRAVYDGIARCNDVLQAVVNATDMTDAEKTQAMAEARFLRAHYHFEARKMFKNVPFIDEITYDPADLNSTKIPNTDEIWPKINADFQYAYENLPAKQSQVGRATKWAAASMLAKAYMFQQKFADAKTLLEAVVASNQYQLVDKYHDNFRATTNNNSESIFEIEFSVNDGAASGENGNVGATLNYPYGGGGVTTCCGFFQPSQNLVNAFKTDANGLPLLDTYNTSDVTNDQGLESTSTGYVPYQGNLDPRLDWTVGRRGIPYLDWGVHPGKAYIRDQSYGGPYSPKKHVMYRSDVGSNTFAGNPRLNANNYRILRLSHVYLWLAEIEAEIGSLDKAMYYVNLIRNRASNPEGFVKNADGTAAANYVVGLYTSFPDKDFARKAIRFEERLEFGMEGHRFFDLVRWGVADVTLNEYLAIEQTKRLYLKGAAFVKGKHEYFPIPLQEILYSQLNGKATLTQNPGY